MNRRSTISVKIFTINVLVQELYVYIMTHVLMNSVNEREEIRSFD